MCKTVDANAHSLLGTINTMLDISKIKSNKLKFDLQKFDLVEMIKEKIEIYSVLHQREVISNLPQSLDVILDSKSINHIIENLFTNAIKYSDSKVIVSVDVGNKGLQISVEDDGMGIDEENKEMIFNMFAQQSEGRNIKEKSGTGVGLHLVKLLCDNNGFKIRVEKSQILGGAKFLVVINNIKG